MTWISVKDRLPEDVSDLLVYYAHDDHITIGYFIRNRWQTEMNWFPKSDVTHWMPVPPPPINSTIVESKMKKMSIPYSEYMNMKIEKEGFHYAFVGYSDFEEVEDEKFHELRLQYLSATKALGEYMNLETSLFL